MIGNCKWCGQPRSSHREDGACEHGGNTSTLFEASSLSPTQAPLKELIERRLELSEELRNGLAGVIAKQDEELKLLRAKVSALSPHPPTSEEWFAVYCDGEACAAYPREQQAQVYASGFAKPCEIRRLGSPHPPSEERKCRD